MEYSSPCPVCSLHTGKEWCRTRSKWHFLFCSSGSIWTPSPCRPTAKISPAPKMNLIAVFLALRVDQNLVDMHSLNIVDMHIHDQDRLGSFSWCREVILTGQFFGLFFQEQQEYFSHSSANANPVYLSALLRGWFAVRQFMSYLLKDLKSCLTAEFILRFT